MYFSLIDPNASDASFATITDHPYLYYVRMDNNHGPYQRVLFRQRVKLDWLIRVRWRAPHIEERLSATWELLGTDADSERAIRWLIALMVLTCDPLAIALTAAASAPPSTAT
jgi:hypothetical protein